MSGEHLTCSWGFSAEQQRLGHGCLTLELAFPYLRDNRASNILVMIFGVGNGAGKVADGVGGWWLHSNLLSILVPKVIIMRQPSIFGEARLQIPTAAANLLLLPRL